jgi:carbon-monoxide dehydrogenase large subunit
VRGGGAHGLGNAILAWMGIDERGPPTTTTFADYLLPSPMEVPPIETLYNETPSPLPPRGAKGAGEVSTIPTAAAVISAIEDALQPFGVRIAQTPITPQKLVELIANGAKA